MKIFLLAVLLSTPAVALNDRVIAAAVVICPSTLQEAIDTKDYRNPSKRIVDAAVEYKFTAAELEQLQKYCIIYASGHGAGRFRNERNK